MQKKVTDIFETADQLKAGENQKFKIMRVLFLQVQGPSLKSRMTSGPIFFSWLKKISQNTMFANVLLSQLHGICL